MDECGLGEYVGAGGAAAADEGAVEGGAVIGAGVDAFAGTGVEACDEAAAGAGAGAVVAGVEAS